MVEIKDGRYSSGLYKNKWYAPPYVWMPPVHTQHKESMPCQTKGLSICPMFGYSLYVGMPPVCLDVPYLWMTPCTFGCPQCLPVCLDIPIGLDAPYVWMPLVCLDTPIGLDVPHVWMMFGCPLYIHNTKKACFVILRGCQYAPMHLDASICLDAPPVCLNTPICLDGPCMFGWPICLDIPCMFGCPHIWTTPICLDAHLYVWTSPMFGCPLFGHPLYVWMLSICLAAPNVWGHPNIWVVSKYIGVSKYTGGIQTYGGNKTYGGIQTYGSIQMYGGIWTPS